MKKRRILLAVVLLVLLTASCGLAKKGTHNPGKNCMWPGCHGHDAPAWTYAGTVFSSADPSQPAKGVTVRITDSTGELKLTTNSAGNFYTSKGNPAGGYRASISTRTATRIMRGDQASGACNSCHAPDDEVTPLHIDTERR